MIVCTKRFPDRVRLLTASDLLRSTFPSKQQMAAAEDHWVNDDIKLLLREMVPVFFFLH
jgi:hypothetical protein